MAFNPPKGPGKGVGNGKPKAPPFNNVTGKAAAQESGYIRRKFAEFNKKNPDAAKQPGSMSRKERRYALEQGAGDAMQRIRNEIMDPTSQKGFEAAKTWLEHTDGRPMQAVEMGGKDGSPLIIQFVKYDDDPDT